ncbi:ChuX/HutX family heme-like substrate-binding protein [Labrys monachus]|uniref:Hemin transport protein n=1 Tax=Labrys monachus TaxID=217067 RepID=A0ABU0FAW2_9HYPH|nr:ChuX/HutX family heme-like substrate-binding protein [Labrys monachus]MDQ0391576.1 putative hemin transport protein [Labrys monachus]
MNELKQQWQGLREAQPGLRIRDAAFRLGVAEAALVETRIGDGVRRLRADVRQICAALPELGVVMSLVRNQAAVHEKDIAFAPAAATGGTIGFSGGEFALEVAPAAIAHAFYVEDANPRGRLRSIQLFDASGEAAWKIYARDKADHAAFGRLVDGLASDDGSPASFARPAVSPGPAGPAAPELRLQPMLERIAGEGLPLSLDVANPAVRQRHRGPVHRIVRMGSWLNVLDPGFDWHLDEGALSMARVTVEGGMPRLVLGLSGGGEAAILSLGEGAASGQEAAWRDIMGQVQQND